MPRFKDRDSSQLLRIGDKFELEPMPTVAEQREHVRARARQVEAIGVSSSQAFNAGAGADQEASGTMLPGKVALRSRDGSFDYDVEKLFDNREETGDDDWPRQP